MNARDDFGKLHDTRHMLEWLADAPEAAIRECVEDILCQQVPGSRLDTFAVTSDPDWLTGARPGEDDPSKAVLVRCAVAFEFALRVTDPSDASFDLRGVFTWAAARLDQPGGAISRVWFDLDGTLAEFGSDGELKLRVYFDHDEA